MCNRVLLSFLLQAYPFPELISFIGSSTKNVEKSEFNLFTNERTNFEQNINAEVREVNKFEVDNSEKSVELHVPPGKVNITPSISRNEHFDCEAEMPILIVNKDNNRTYIWTSTAHVNDDFHWDKYKKVSEMNIKSEFGVNKTLKEILAEISRKKDNNTPKRYRPVSSIVQGGSNAIVEKPMENQQNDKQKANDSRQFGNCCDDESIKNRSNFPVLTPLN